MPQPKFTYTERQEASAAAKKAMLERLKPRPHVMDPDLEARKAAAAALAASIARGRGAAAAWGLRGVGAAARGARGRWPSAIRSTGVSRRVASTPASAQKASTLSAAALTDLRFIFGGFPLLAAGPAAFALDPPCVSY